MTIIENSKVRIPITDADKNHSSYVDWSAILGGIVLASGISLVLLTFGAAVGLSFTSSETVANANMAGRGIGIGLWFIWVQVSSFMAGSYLTGRMRHRFHDSTEHEVEVRDGMHGLLVWAGAVILGSWLALSGISAVGAVAGNAAGAVAQASGNALPALSGESPNNYFTDMLLRPSESSTQAPKSPAEISSEFARILANAGAGKVSDDDRAYLSSVVARSTGLPQADAEARVERTIANYDESRAVASAALETARKFGIISAFLIAASLLVSAAGSYWAAGRGGSHRDEAAVFGRFFRRA